MRAYIIPMTPKRIKLLLGRKIKKEVKTFCPITTESFKVYVYCPIRRCDSKREHMIMSRDSDGEYDNWKGKVIAEFVCDELKPVPQLPSLKFFEETRLTPEEYETYRRKQRSLMKTLRVTQLKEYAVGKPLSDFKNDLGNPVSVITGTFTKVKEVAE